MIRAFTSERYGAKALEQAAERAADAMGRDKTHPSMAAAMLVLSEVKGFKPREQPKLSWVQMEHVRSAKQHVLAVSEQVRAESLPLVAQMIEAGEVCLRMVDHQLPDDAAFGGSHPQVDGRVIRFSTYFLEATVKDAAGDGTTTKQLYFTFGDVSVFTQLEVVAKVSTEKPRGYKESYAIDQYPRSSAMAKRMVDVCGATNFSLVLRNSEHMMRYIVGGVWHSMQTLNTAPFYKEVIVKEFAAGFKEKARTGSIKTKVKVRILSLLNIAPKEVKMESTATRRPVYCKMGCSACAKEEDGANSDGEFEIETEGHTPEPAIFTLESETALDVLPVDTMQNDINIVLVGATGCGKSHLLNVLFNCDVSASSSSTRSVTADIHFFRGRLNFDHPVVQKYLAPLYSTGFTPNVFKDKLVNIIDTVGFCDTKRDPMEVMNLIKSKLENNMVHVHKVIVVTAAGQRTQKDHIKPIKEVMKWLDYENHKKNFVFVYNKCDGLSRDERERNQMHVLEDIGASKIPDTYMPDPDAKEGSKKMIVSSAVAVGFPPRDRHMRKDTVKSLRQLALAIVTFTAPVKPVPLSQHSLAKCLRSLIGSG